MSYPAFEQYLARLRLTGRQMDEAGAPAKVRLDDSGRALGTYFNSTLTSAFQPIRRVGDRAIVGYEGFARCEPEYNGADSDRDLSIWNLLEGSASDEESVALDRLCRMLHAINFYRQPAAAGGSQLYLSVHGRLLAAVGSNHGMAFRHILNLLGLPHEQIVLQIPAVTGGQGWLLNYVLDNYRRNGFRLAAGAADVSAALELIDTVQADIVKIDGRLLDDDDSLARLLPLAARRGIKIAFKRVDSPAVAEKLRRLAKQSGQTIYVQGYLWDRPGHALPAEPVEIGLPQLP
ncbi:MAG: hypothetical protein JWP38_686 [Herbaspirillum sp.]|jgi:EAL domain-containing protein (putative c-di-GMP-specific phosphodiesterase class I)|nr:hypothetical protein [Herbaspirillum sp.]